MEHRNSEENELENPREPLLSEEIQELINGSVSGHSKSVSAKTGKSRNHEVYDNNAATDDDADECDAGNAENDAYHDATISDALSSL